MDYVSAPLRRKVIATAKHRCGYCLTAQEISGAQMHIEHILPLSRGGTSDEDNLWLSCAWCNSFKGTKTHEADLATGQTVPLFNPRFQEWHEHFQWNDSGAEIIGITPTGRATVITLNLNNEYIVPARRHWVLAGWHPPKV